MYQNTYFTIIAVALAAMLFNTDSTQAQSVISSSTPSQSEWVEYPAVVYPSNTARIQAVPAAYVSSIVETTPNPIYEVAPSIATASLPIVQEAPIETYEPAPVQAELEMPFMLGAEHFLSPQPFCMGGG